MEKDITVLAIESSCDETAAAVVRNGKEATVGYDIETWKKWE